MRTAAISVRLQRESKKQLDQLARHWGRTPSETGAQLLEEALRRAAFSHIEFRSTPTSRQACLIGTRLAVWQVADLLQQHGGSVEKTARHLGCPKECVRAAELYASAYPEEIQALITENKAVTFESLSRMLPNLEKIAA